MKAGHVVLTGCGITVLAFFLLIVIGIVWLANSPESGVLVSNTMEDYALEYIEENNILNDGEKIEAYYDVTLNLDSTEAAILTNERVIYHKDGRTESLTYSEIDNIDHIEEFGDNFEITSTSGKIMLIEIAPWNGGATFKKILFNNYESSRDGLSFFKPFKCPQQDCIVIVS